MNNNNLISFRKAGFIACLFCFALIPALRGQSLKFGEPVHDNYRLVLDLNFDAARKALPDVSTVDATYVATFSETLELLLTEDPSLFTLYEQRFEDRLFKNPKSNDEKFLLAEMHLQWVFVYLKFGHELDAASHFRDAYKIAMECRRKAPAYLPIRKTTGMLEVMVGAVPEKYNWVMDLFGIHGSIENGLKDLTLAGSSNEPIAGEARLIKSLFEGYVLQQPEKAAHELHHGLANDSSASLILGAASLYIKAAQSENAVKLLQRVQHATPLANYFLGEVLLHKGEYEKAISSYQVYATNYKGNNNLKDAWFKMGICYFLLQNESAANRMFEVAKQSGTDIVEADRSAARTMAAGKLPNYVLTKARYFTDGGYYDQARVTLSNISDTDLTSKRDRVEYYYRRARLEHGSNHSDAAKIFYQQTIDMAGSEPWYFAPNACLQMGYILIEDEDESGAREYFRMALSYKNHEYKNSIDSKAKTALNRLKR